MTERILTLHPEGKKGVNISKEKYETMKQAILDALRQHGEMTFSELARATGEKLAGRFDGSINWYTISVQLDLEARGVIQRTSARPHRLKLVAKSASTDREEEST